jgi:hypothetical protein
MSSAENSFIGGTGQAISQVLPPSSGFVIRVFIGVNLTNY